MILLPDRFPVSALDDRIVDEFDQMVEEGGKRKAQFESAGG
jgi:hypothetical protein